MITAQLEPALKDARAGEHFQFERHGYFIADPVDSNPARRFQSAVTLRDPGKISEEVACASDDKRMKINYAVQGNGPPMIMLSRALRFKYRRWSSRSVWKNCAAGNARQRIHDESRMDA